MKVLIVDDHPVFRDGLRAALTSADAIDELHEAGSVAEAISVAADVAPDVVLMDLQLPDGSGIDATRGVLAQVPGTLVVVLTMTGDEDAVTAALAAGARGYLLKGADRAAIIGAIAAAYRGEVILGAGVADRILAQFASGAAKFVPLPELTAREREVLGLVAQGLTNQAIAARLVVSPKTVRNHVSNVLMKLQVASRAEAGARARDAGI